MKKKKDKPGSDSESENRTDEEKKMLENTRYLLKSIQNEPLAPSDKESIWNRVEDHVLAQKQNTFRRVWLSLAASVSILLLVGAGYLFLRKNPGKTMQAIAAKAALDSGDTRLLLADQRVISLQKRNSDLVYQQNGETIQIDSASTVGQRITDKGQHFNTLIVPYGKRSTITLLDGTKIWLNSGSKLVYPTQFDKDQREVFLEGQAYFSVVHSDEKPFYVHTRNMKVQVFGTEFDVSAYDDDKEVSAVLASGSIELTINEQSLFRSEKRKITPGTRAVFTPSKASLETQRVNVEQFVSWKEGYLMLQSDPLADILKKLSRYYKVDIGLIDNVLGKHTFTGTLDLQEDIGPLLDIISAATSLQYQKKERGYVFEKSAIRP